MTEPRKDNKPTQKPAELRQNPNQAEVEVGSQIRHDEDAPQNWRRDEPNAGGANREKGNRRGS